MTIAVSVKVNDGLVFSTDSASTIEWFDADGNSVGVENVFNNANKIFNLRKGLPIGAITWGLGSIGVESIETVIKDFRLLLTEGDSDQNIPPLDKRSYSIEEVANRLRQFVYVDRYMDQFPDRTVVCPSMGFIVGGYTWGGKLAQEFIIDIDDFGHCAGPTELHAGEAGSITWHGQPEPIIRLFWGVGSGALRVLHENLGLDPDTAGRVHDILLDELKVPLINPAMPIQDAVELAEYLVDVAVRFSRFLPGPTTVGGPIEIAAITKHEGFKWVKRKYFYPRGLNPEGEAR